MEPRREPISTTVLFDKSGRAFLNINFSVDGDAEWDTNAGKIQNIQVNIWLLHVSTTVCMMLHTTLVHCIAKNSSYWS